MALVLSLSERFRLASELTELSRRASIIIQQVIDLEASLKQDEMGLNLSFAKTQLDQLLIASRANYTVLDDANHIDLLSSTSANSGIWPVTISPSFSADLTGFAIDNTVSPPTITAVGGSPFDVGVLLVGDVIDITLAEQPEHNGRATITIITTSLITLTAGDMPGTGINNSNDTTAVITLLER